MQEMQKQPVQATTADAEPISLPLKSVPELLERAKTRLQEGRAQEALQFLNAVIDAAPELEDSWHAKALALRQLGRFDEAVEVLDTALQQIGAKPSLLMDKAGFHLLQSDFAGAAEIFDRLISLEPQNKEGWLGKARSLLSDGDAKQALDCVERAIMIDQGSARGYSLRGDCLLNLGRWADSFAAFDEAARHNPDLFDASNWTSRGDQFRQHGQSDLALAAYSRAIAQDKQNSKAWYGKGLILIERHDFEGALDAFKRASTVDSFLEAGMIYAERRDFAGALRFFERAQQAKLDDPRPWKFLGWALGNLERSADAQAAFAHATALDEKDAVVWNLLGNSLYNLGRLDEASRSYERSVEIDPGFSWAYYNLTFVRLQQKRFDEALQSINRAIDLRPDEEEFWVHRLWVLNKYIDTEDSEVDSLADQTLANISPNTDLRLEVAHFLADYGHLARARELIHSAKPLATEDEKKRLDWAELLLKVGDTDAAFGLIRSIDPARLRHHISVTCSFLHLLADRLAGAPQLSDELLVNFLDKLTEQQQVDHRDARDEWNLRGVRLLITRSELPVLDKFVLATLIDLQEAKIDRNDLSFVAEFEASVKPRDQG
jgi:tetratricopeptide (TPR) repeat protein